MQIRSERPGEADAIHALTRTAFADAPHSSHTEQYIVDALRHAGALAVSLVAVSPVQLSDGSPGWYGLGPLSVAPGRQRQGVGSALMRAAVEALQACGAAGCVLLGDPGYYGRFGFRAEPRLRLVGVPAAYFQALRLQGRWPDAEVEYHAAFAAVG